MTTEAERDRKVYSFKRLVDYLRGFRDDYAADEYIPSEINRLVLLVQGRIYELNEIDYDEEL